MSLSDDTISLLQSLIRNGCVNYFSADSGQEVTNADTLEAFFAGTDVRVERYEPHPGRCLLYTSDAADDMQCVDLGGRRIIKKKKK